MAERLTVFYLRDYVPDVLAEAYRDYELSTACTTFGIPDPPNPPQYNSKRVYVRHRLASVRLPEMIAIAELALPEATATAATGRHSAAR